MADDRDRAAADAYDELYSPPWRASAGRGFGKAAYAERIRHTFAIVGSHREELTALAVAARDIEAHTMRRPARLMLPSEWGTDPELVNGGTYFGYQLLVVDGIDKPMLAYSHP